MSTAEQAFNNYQHTFIPLKQTSLILRNKHTPQPFKLDYLLIVLTMSSKKAWYVMGIFGVHMFT